MENHLDGNGDELTPETGITSVGEDELEDMAYLTGLHLDSDLTRLINNTPGLVGNNQILMNDLLWNATTSSQQLLLHPSSVINSSTTTSTSVILPTHHPSFSLSSNSKSLNISGGSDNNHHQSGFVSDRTKLNLNMKLQQKQLMQQQHNNRTTIQQMRNNNQQSQQQHQQGFNNAQTNSRVTNQPNFNMNLSISNINNKIGSNNKLLSSIKSSSSSSTLITQNPNKNQKKSSHSNSKQVKTNIINTEFINNNFGNLINSVNLSATALNQNQFVNFDPASFLDSCFNPAITGLQSGSELSGNCLKNHSAL